MTRRQAFLLRFVALGFLFGAAAQPAVAVDAADVGRTLLAAGDVVAVRGGQTVRLAVGSPIQDGDTLRTGQSSNLQVRFVDESIISLKESSELRIDNFKFTGNADGSERAFFTLVKGGLRSMTGAIGGKNNKNYSMRTPVATLGVRGTDYTMTLCQKDCRNADGALARDGLYGRVLGISHGSNSIVVTSGRDSRVIGIDENFFVADTLGRVERLLTPPPFVANRLEGRRQAERQLAKVETATAEPIGLEKTATGGVLAESRPNAKPEPVAKIEYVSTENLGKESKAAGKPRIVIYPLIDGSDKAIVDAASTSFDASNNLTAFDVTGICATCAITNTVQNTASIVDTSSVTLVDGGLIYWGRWDNGSVASVASGSTLVSTSTAGVPFVVGDATTRLPTSGSFVYTFAGGPPAVDTAGAVGGQLNQGAFRVTFGTIQSVSVATPLALSAGGVNYTLSSACGGVCVFNAPSAWLDMSLSGVCSGGACLAAAPASGKVTGLLVGPLAGGLSVAGNISSPAPTVTFAGAFAR